MRPRTSPVIKSLDPDRKNEYPKEDISLVPESIVSAVSENAVMVNSSKRVGSAL
jgi:hypothetical protein